MTHHNERGASQKADPFPGRKPVLALCMRLFYAAVVKVWSAIVVVTAGWSVIAITALAQDFAPPSLAAQLLSITVLTGSPPFTSSGDYKLYTSPLGSNFVVLGNAEAGLNWGTYSYTQTGTNSGLLALVDAQSGLHTSFSLLLGSPSAGQMTLTNVGAAGVQTASFLATNYTVVAPAELFLPSYTNGTFLAYLSGQVGAVYTLDVSSNIQNWSSLASLSLAGLTGSFTDTNAGSSNARVYRARVASVDYAPSSISGQSLNFAVAEGAAPFSTNGFFQFFADASAAGYQMLSGPSMTNTPGAYQYSKIVPGAALIACVDSQNVTNYINLVFTGPASGFYYASNTTPGGFQAGSFTMADGPVVYLGNYHFTPDTSRAASVLFAAAGNPASLSVTDAFSNVWTLNLPADALLTPQTITMTPTASVDSSGAALPATAAVLLDPDGIQFCDGVTLTLTTPAPLGSNASLMSTAEDGSDVNLVVTTNQANSYTTTLFHFSSGAVTDPTSQQLQGVASTEAMIHQAFNQAQSDAQKLEANYQPPSPPPDYDWPCDPAEQAEEAQAANTYAAGVFQQEQDISKRLFNEANALAMLGDGSLLPQAGSVVSQLFQQDIFKKLNFLVNNYGVVPNQFYPVCLVTLAMVRQAQLLGIPVPPTLLLNLANDGNTVANHYLNNLRNNHDYSGINVVFTLVKLLNFLGGDTTSLLAGLGKALTFQLTLDLTADADSSSAPGSGDSITLEANGTFQMTYAGNNLQGSGTCNYVSGMNTVTVNGVRVYSVSIAPGQTFPENCTLVLDCCPGDSISTATFTFSGFGSPTEAWLFPPPVGTEVLADLIGITDVCFASLKTSRGFSFLMPLQNGNAQAVNASITEKGSNIAQSETSTLHLVLQHTP